MVKSKQKIVFFWFRRDLRLHDNTGLIQALKSAYQVLPIFIFDKNILDDLQNKEDMRVQFIYQTVKQLKVEINAQGGDLMVCYGDPKNIWKRLFEAYNIAAIYTNRDYEPYAKERDEMVRNLARVHEAAYYDFKDHVVYDREEVRKKDGTPYTVFTPYKKTWLLKFNEDLADKNSTINQNTKSEEFQEKWLRWHAEELLSMESIGFRNSETKFPSKEIPQTLVRNYDRDRDYPALAGTSKLGLHFRFGTISIRRKVIRAQQLNAVFLSELIWRDFYAQILDAFPHVVTQSFRPKYDNIQWRENQEEFERWCQGNTGYPLVDAGMRQLNETGFMHNRVRMVTASFLCKHLLMDWRKGEAYFAKKLLDYDLASNNGGWQWAAGTGTDAAPYFRIFNPHTQLKKFDPQLTYVKKWVPEFGTNKYVAEIVEHKFARERCLTTYKAGLS